MKVKLYLHGHLKDKVQKDFVEVEATTLLDALKNFEIRYRKVLKAPLDIGRWKVRIKGFETRESWYVPLFVDEVHIYPEFKMGKSQSGSAWVQIGIGVAIIALAVWTGGAALAAYAAAAAAGTTVGIGTTVAAYATMAAISIGIGLISQGLITLLFPQPGPDTADNNSKYLGVGQNTTKAGTRIPFGYGKYKIAGQIISYTTSSSNLKKYGE